MENWEEVEESTVVMTDGEAVFIQEDDEIYTLQGEWYYLEAGDPNESGWVFSSDDVDYYIGEFDQEDDEE